MELWLYYYLMAPRRYSIIRLFPLYFLLAGSVIVALQYGRSDIKKFIGDYADEPGHFVTSRMIRDYIVTFPHTPPLTFAKAYYLHYPKVALGHWPPFFHAVWAFWFLIFPGTPASILFLSTVLAICFAVTPGLVVARKHGAVWGLLATLMLVSSPVVLALSRMVMLDFQYGIFCFLATVSFAEFLEERKRWYAIAFCALAVIACYTKYNGYLIFGVPPLIFLFTRTFRVRSWLVPACLTLLVLILVIPFPLVFARDLKNPEPPLDWRTLLMVIGGYTKALAQGVGWLVVVLAVLGFWAALQRPDRETPHRWFIVAMAALVIAAWGFHIALTREALARYLTPAMCCLIVLAVEGLRYLLRTNVPWSRGIVAVLVFAVVALNLHASWLLRRKTNYPYGAVAEWVERNVPNDRRILLVDSEAKAEGMMIAEMVGRESKPTSYILRATKLLCRTDWEGMQYQPYFTDVSPMQDFLEKVPIHYLIIDTTPGRHHWLHHQLLLEMTASHPDKWKPLLQLAVPADCNGCDAKVTLYEAVGAPPSSSPNLRMTVPGMIRRPLMFEFLEK